MQTDPTPQRERIHSILLDIEGTVCTISWVRDILIPHALALLPSILATEWDSPAFLPYRAAFPPAHRTSAAALLAHVRDLTARDTKASYLKSLQGYVWKRAYESGELTAPVFGDVAPALRRWSAGGLRVAIYSSGSADAQRLFFAHASAGDLRSCLRGGFFDTVTAGAKTEMGSYVRIAGAAGGGPVGEWLFLSDNVLEIEAAREAGMRVGLVVRPGNAPVGEGEAEGVVRVRSFDEVDALFGLLVQGEEGK